MRVGQHSIEEVGGLKRIEALGAIELLAGDDLLLGSLGNMSQTTASHSHPENSQPPSQSGTFTQQAEQAAALADQLLPIIE